MHAYRVCVCVYCFNALKIKFCAFQADFELVYLPTDPPPKGFNRACARSPSVNVMLGMDPRNLCMLGNLDLHSLNFASYNMRYKFSQDDSS